MSTTHTRGWARSCNRPRRAARPAPRALVGAGALFVAAAAWIGATTSCSGPVDPGVSPLEGAGSVTESPGAQRPASGGGSPTAGGVPGQSSPGDLRAPEAQGAPATEVAELLERYDAAISALHAEPLAAADDDHPLSRAWLEVVVGGSQLDRSVRGSIVAAAMDDSMAVVPDSSGTSFVNVASEVREAPDGSVSWTNCGYAPGIGVHLRSGEVLDDNRTSTIGRGAAIRDAAGNLVVSELWDDETRLLDPGEADPCTTTDRTGGHR